MTRNKFGAIKTTIDGITFDSRAEGRRYTQLKLMERAGEIEAIELQPRFDLIVNGKKCGFYKADFGYIDKALRQRVIEDVKGVATPIYRLKKKLVAAIYGVNVIEISKNSQPAAASEARGRGRGSQRAPSPRTQSPVRPGSGR